MVQSRKKKTTRKVAVKKKPKHKAAKKAKPSPQNKPKNRTQKIWHIFLFEERFELSEDFRGYRTTPLEFVREFVASGKDDKGIKYGIQIEALKRSPNRHVLRSVFVDLRDKAANRSRAYRGYLLNVKDQPASLKDIAGWVGLAPVECRRALKELDDIGLIEWVPVPVWDMSKNEKPAKKSDSPERSGPDRSSPGALKNGNGKRKP